MASLSLNGLTVSFVEDNDLRWKMDVHFAEVFENYLTREYGIDSKTLKEILKDIAPEKFV